MHTFKDSRKQSLRLVAMLSFVVFTVFSQQVKADMLSWFKKTEIELSPEVSGTLTLNGKPVAGATVHRYLSYGDNKFHNSINSNVDGRFTLPAHKAKIRVSAMFDTWISQELIVEHADKKIEIWSTGSTSVLNSNSITQLLSSMNCELSAPEMRLVIPWNNPQSPPLSVASICTFEQNQVIIEKELWK